MVGQNVPIRRMRRNVQTSRTPVRVGTFLAMRGVVVKTTSRAASYERDDMDLFTASWSSTSGWSGSLPAWDGPGTFVLVFGSSDLLDDGTPLRAGVDSFPGSAVLGRRAGWGHAFA